MKPTKNLIFRTLVIAAALVLSACSTTKTTSSATGEQVGEATVPTQAQGEKIGQRAVKRWENIINKKFDDAYEMLSPGYRQTHDKVQYAQIIGNRPVHWTKASYVDHDCPSADVCMIRVTVAFNVLMPGAGRVNSENIVEEKWLRVDGEWFFFPDNAGK